MRAVLSVVVAVATVGCVVQAPPGYAPGYPPPGPPPARPAGIDPQALERARQPHPVVAAAMKRNAEEEKARAEAQRIADEKAIEAERQAEAGRVGAEREKEAKIQAQQQALLEEAKALKARIDNPAPAKKVSSAQLSGKAVERFKGQRIRVTGPMSFQGAETLAGGKPTPESKLLAFISLGKKRWIGCGWRGLAAHAAAAKVETNDTASLAGTMFGSETDPKGVEIVVLRDCDLPVLVKKQSLARYEAAKLTRDYASNQDAASNEYDNYRLEVAGTVTAVAHGWVHLAGHAAGHRVMCELSEGVSAEAVATLGRGRRAVLVGAVSGFHGGDWRDRFKKSVVIHGCEIVGRK